MKRFLFGLVCVTLASLFYVYTQVEAVRIGYVINKQEAAKSQALDRARTLQYNIARLKAPDNLERRLEERRIQLESPKSWQTLVLPGARSPIVRPVDNAPPFFARFFVGTAQAEAKESR